MIKSEASVLNPQDTIGMQCSYSLPVRGVNFILWYRGGQFVGESSGQTHDRRATTVPLLPLHNGVEKPIDNVGFRNPLRSRRVRNGLLCNKIKNPRPQHDST